MPDDNERLAVTVSWEDGGPDCVIPVPSKEEGMREVCRQIGIAAVRMGGWSEFRDEDVAAIKAFAEAKDWAGLAQHWHDMVNLNEIDIRLLPVEDCTEGEEVDMRWDDTPDWKSAEEEEP